MFYSACAVIIFFLLQKKLLVQKKTRTDTAVFDVSVWNYPFASCGRCGTVVHTHLILKNGEKTVVKPQV